MTHRAYLKRYYTLVKRFVALGVRYIRKVYWRLTARQSKRYAVQLRDMRQTLAKLVT